MRKIYGIGETLLDIIFKGNQPVAAKAGGSVLNALVSLGRAGLHPEFISEYGKDSVGDIIGDFLKESHVGTQFITQYQDGQSALALAFLDDSNNASYTFYKDYPEDRLSNIPVKTNPDDIIVFGSIYGITRAVRPNLVKFLDIAGSAGSMILYDPNFRKAHLHELDELRPMILENIKMADMIRGSDEDFKNIFNAENSRQAYLAVHDICPVLVYTANISGVYVHTPAGMFQFPVKEIRPVSTIGAGDNFNAGIIYSLIRDNINKEKLERLSENQWKRVIETAVDFATEVCMSWDNYITNEFALKIKNNAGV